MTPIEQILSTVDWQEAPQQDVESDGLPYATHSGILKIFGVQLRCYRLNDGRAIFDADDFDRLFADAGGDHELPGAK